MIPTDLTKSFYINKLQTPSLYPPIGIWLARSNEVVPERTSDWPLALRWYLGASFAAHLAWEVVQLPQRASIYSLTRLSRNALPMTLTEESAIAAAAMMGESMTPRNGYSTPAAMGTPAAL